MKAFLLLPAIYVSQVSYSVRSEMTVISSWGELDMKYQRYWNNILLFKTTFKVISVTLTNKLT